MSDGSRSGVNWMRRNSPPSERASARASVVLPTPGTSSSRRCPSQSSATSARSITGRFPMITRSTLASIRSPNAATGATASLAGVFWTFRFASARADNATGLELSVIAAVLLGGVSIFGGVGSMVGVLLSTYLVLNLRNGLVIAGITGNTQTGIIGLLLILSVLLPNVAGRVRERLRRGQTDPGVRAPPAGPGEAAPSHAAPG